MELGPENPLELGSLDQPQSISVPVGAASTNSIAPSVLSTHPSVSPGPVFDPDAFCSLAGVESEEDRRAGRTEEERAKLVSASIGGRNSAADKVSPDNLLQDAKDSPHGGGSSETGLAPLLPAVAASYVQPDDSSLLGVPKGDPLRSQPGTADPLTLSGSYSNSPNVDYPPSDCPSSKASLTSESHLSSTSTTSLSSAIRVTSVTLPNQSNSLSLTNPLYATTRAPTATFNALATTTPSALPTDASEDVTPHTVLAPTFLTVLDPTQLPPQLSPHQPLKRPRSGQLDSEMSTQFQLELGTVEANDGGGLVGSTKEKMNGKDRKPNGEGDGRGGEKVKGGNAGIAPSSSTLTHVVSANAVTTTAAMPSGSLSPGHRRSKSDGVGGTADRRSGHDNTAPLIVPAVKLFSSSASNQPGTTGSNANSVGAKVSAASVPASVSASKLKKEVAHSVAKANGAVSSGGSGKEIGSGASGHGRGSSGSSSGKEKGHHGISERLRTGSNPTEIFSPDCRRENLSPQNDSGLNSKTPSPPKRIPTEGPVEFNVGANDDDEEDEEEDEVDDEVDNLVPSRRPASASDASKDGRQGMRQGRSSFASTTSAESQFGPQMPRNNSVGGVGAGGDMGTPDRSTSVTSFPPHSKSKKAWYSALTPTYKTRSEEFVRLFKKVKIFDVSLVPSCSSFSSSL